MELLNKCLNILKDKGADKAEVLLSRSIKDEMNVNTGEISLLRTREEYSLEMTAIIDTKKDSITINRIDDRSIEEAASELINNAENSQPDEANDISEEVVEQDFDSSAGSLDIDLMHKRLKYFIMVTSEDYPELVIEEAVLEYIDGYKYYANSNGVNLSAHNDNYLFETMFFSKRGKETSSFNHTSILSKNLEKELSQLGSLSYLLKESVEHLQPQGIDNKKFTGDLIVTPDCMNDIISFIMAHLSNYYLIAGISNFADKLGEKVLDEKFTLRTEPDSTDLARKSFFANDGIVNRNDYIFEKGILKNYLLNLYGSKKTGYDRGPSTGVNLIVQEGNQTLDEMVSNIDQGIMLARFSGGRPAPNGDFSGVAKNSYYIENGEIKYPVKETMISGNLFELFQDIKGISSERINNGYSLMPFMHFSGVTVSSK